MRLETGAATDTERAGAELAARLTPGDVVLLSGELGAGKTTFVRGALRALGITVPVTSPTFTIGHRYRLAGDRLAGALAAVSHLDLYRLGDLAGEDPDLLADYISPATISFVEWPGGKEGAIADVGRIRYRVHLAHAGGERRIMDIEAV